MGPSHLFDASNKGRREHSSLPFPKTGEEKLKQEKPESSRLKFWYLLSEVGRRKR